MMRRVFCLSGRSHLVLVAAVLSLLGCRCTDETPELLRRIVEREWQRLDPKPWLLPLFSHSRPEVRERACLAAGRFGLDDEASLAALESRLRDPVAGVRRQAALAMQLVVTAQPPGRRRRELQRRVAHGVLERLHREEDPDCRRQLLRVLGAAAPVGPRPTRSLVAAARVAETRVAALEALAILGHRGAVAPGAAASEVRASLITALRTSDAAVAALAAAEMPKVVDAPLIAALLQAAGRREASPILVRRVTRAVARAGAAEQLDWLVERSRSHDRSIQAEAIRGMSAAGPDGAKRLARRLRRMWRSVSADHYRLTGAPLQPVLLGLTLLTPHAGLPEVRELGLELLELADATDAAVTYVEKEAHSVDLVHCAAARLVDLGAGELKHTLGCGTARSVRLTGARRKLFALEVAARLGDGGASPDELLARFRDAAEPELRRAAVLALEQLGTANDGARVAILGRALADRDPSVAAAAAVVAGQRGVGGATLVPALARRIETLDARRWPGEACALARAVARLASRERARRLLGPLLDVPVSGVRRCVDAALARLDQTRAERAGRWPVGVTRALKDRIPRRAKVVTSRGVFYMRLMVDGAPGAVTRLLERRRYQEAQVRHGAAEGRLVLASARQAGAPPPLPLPSELGAEPFDAGSVGLLEPAGRDSGQGDLFILLDREPWRDGRFTLVAQVEPKGMQVLWRLQPGDQISGIYPVR